MLQRYGNRNPKQNPQIIFHPTFLDIKGCNQNLLRGEVRDPGERYFEIFEPAKHHGLIHTTGVNHIIMHLSKNGFLHMGSIPKNHQKPKGFIVVILIIILLPC